MTRSLRYILLASLALNLALGVGLAWVVFHSRPVPAEMRHREPRPMFHPGSLRHALSEERGELVDAVMAKHREAMHARIGHMAKARDAVREALQAEPFEPARLDDAFAQLRASESRTAEEAHALLADLASRATPEERQRLARLIGPRHRGERRERTP
ncbi:periplasmic heavy metal sensor [Xanthomonadaceae bacterium XH05]|nr:periplasmic heavy metal sensor [Xanthomonadaceae bacterium XH05]